MNKLRTWDERNKVMHNDFQFIRSGTEGNDWILFVSDKQPIGSRSTTGQTWDNNPYFAQQLKIMESVGLVDDERVDIFTEDIVEVVVEDVLGNECGKHIGIIDRTYHQFMIDFPKTGMSISIDEETFRSIMVIGNVYQNPELLT